MAFKKKSTRKTAGKSTGKRPFYQRPNVIIGVLLALIGILLLIVSLAPDNVGSAGKWVHTHFLDALLGKAAVLASVYFVLVGLGLLWAKRKVLCLIGLTCLMFNALVIIDAMYFKTQDNLMEPEIYGAKLGFLIRDPLLRYIGTAGLVGLCSVVMLLGLILLIPRSVFTGIWQRMLAHRKEKKALARIQKQAAPTKPSKPTKPPKSMPTSAPLADEPESLAAPDTPMAQLNLQPYQREFVKVHNGLFEEHVVFDRSLPVGERRQELIDAFAAFNVQIDIGDIKRGPSFEQYEIIPGKSVKVAQIRSRIEDISLRLRQKIHIGKMSRGSLVAEVPLRDRQIVPYGYLLEDTSDDNMELPVAVGVDASFTPFSVDLTELPHLLIAGTTGSGKSVFVKTLIASILYHLTPNEARLVLIDPKRVEFGIFASSLFCACDIITDFEDVPPVFNALVAEMEERYTLLEQAGVSDIRHYNTKVPPKKRRPYIVVVVDEFADLLMQNADGFEQPAIRLAQKARACGIHLVLATQRPSADVIKGLLKTNIPGRVALSVSSKIDSKIILDTTGAENLTGKGDLICLCPAFRDGIRLQGAFISNKDIKKIIAANRKQTG